MINIKPIKTSIKKKIPYYSLVFNYMIGDSNGYTKETVRINKDNPYVERFCKLLNKLEPCNGHWGVVLDRDRMGKTLDEKKITKKDYKFLCRLMWPEDGDKFEDVENDYMNEFESAIKSDTEYSFLVFQSVDLFYVDEFSVKHETEFK
jgi:hypothetical protein